MRASLRKFVGQNAAEMYLNGAVTPVASYAGLLSAANNNRVVFGDGSADIVSESRVRYIRWTNQENVVLEPASLTLVALGGALVLSRRRR